jgi:filamentous hemagglutinin family protein
MKGQATLSYSTNRLLINQKTALASFSWTGFNVGAMETVRFKTPGVSSVSMNFIGGSAPARISGQVVSNGILEFMDANGLIFGSGSTVNAAGVRAYASATPGGPLTGLVTNEGTIEVSSGGSVLLAGQSVVNSGTITAPSGTVILSAGSIVTLSETATSSLSLATTGAGAVTDSGVIRAENVSGPPGTIILQSGMASGTTTLAPTAVIDAAAPTSGNGGTITINAATVVLDEKAPLEVSSAQGKAGSVTIDPAITQVGTASALLAIDQSQGSYLNSSTVCIELTANLDLGGSSWTPLGTSSTAAFTGTFNGQGYTVSDYTVTATGNNGTGFIGTLGSGGVVKNLVVSGTVNGGSDSNVGGVVGTNNGGTVERSGNEGTVSGYQGVGGVVGLNGGVVTLSWNSGTINGSGPVGGVTGWNNGGTATYDGNTGNVTGLQSVGGITGCTDTTISYSWNSGSVTGSSVVGGIVGFISPGGSVNDSYNTGSILGTNGTVGGIAGISTSAVPIIDSYNAGTVAGTTGLSGVANAGGLTTDYFNTTVNAPSTTASSSGACGGVALKEGTGTGELGNTASYSGWRFASGWNGNGFSTPGAWIMGTISPNKGINGTTTAPILVADLPADTVTVQGGSAVYTGQILSVSTTQTLTLGGQALTSGISASAGPQAGSYQVTPRVTLSLPTTQSSVGSYEVVSGTIVITQPQPSQTRNASDFFPPPLLGLETGSSGENVSSDLSPVDGLSVDRSNLSESGRDPSEGSVLDSATLP